MKTNQIAEGGYWRLRKGQKALAAESIDEKYTALLAQPGPGEKREIEQRLLVERQRREKMMNHKPFPKALW